MAWHGEHFREEFYQQTLPLKVRELSCDDVKITRFVLLSMLNTERELHAWFAVRHNMDGVNGKDEENLHYYRIPSKDLFDIVFDMDIDQVREDLKEAALRIIMGKNYGLIPYERHRVAEHLEIDLKNEWRLNKDYLNKKTIKEMLTLGEEFGIFEDKKAQTYLYESLNKKRGSFKVCKKHELIQVILDSGVDLAGKVPDEILDVEFK